MDSTDRGTEEVSEPTGRDEVVRECEARREATIAPLKRKSSGPWVRVALPSNREVVTQLPSGRRKSFEAHLRAIIEESSDSPGEPPDSISANDGAGQNPVNRLLAQACGTCRGHCCRKAGDQNAYLDSDSIRAYRARNPGASNDDVVAAYLGRIPEESYAGSCVFHASRGCALPGAMRSEMCNWFLCDSLIRLSRSIALEDRATVFAVAMQDGNPDRLAVFDADGVHYEEDPARVKGLR